MRDDDRFDGRVEGAARPAARLVEGSEQVAAKTNQVWSHFGHIFVTFWAYFGHVLVTF
jgi:hypothetical protein